MYCYTCKDERMFRRHVGLISLFWLFWTGGLWIFIILFYTKKCSGCGCTIGDNRAKRLIDEGIKIPSQPVWLTECQDVSGDVSKIAKSGQPVGLYVAYVVVAVVVVYGMYAWCGAV